MNTQKLQNDKLHLIQWITQIQDHALIEKIKSLMSTSNESFQLITEREEIETLMSYKCYKQKGEQLLSFLFD
jgi:hypothetical protein